MTSLPGFNGQSSLARIAAKAAVVPGCSRLCVHLSDRLAGLYPLVSSAPAGNHRRSACSSYCDTASGFLQMLRVQLGRNFLLFRLATSHDVVNEVHKAHARLDDIYRALGVEEDAALATAWRESWRNDRAHQESYFAEAIEDTTPEDMAKEFVSPMKLEETLVMLDKQIRVYQAAEPSLWGVSETLLQLMEDARDDVMLTCANSLPEKLYKWFVHADAVEVERPAVGEGMFSKVYRAKWATPGREGAVAFKRLTKTNDRETFSSEIEVWCGLDHRNVLRLLGANHIVDSKFFICEFVNAGNFAQFFEVDYETGSSSSSNSKHLWSLFVQAATGLKYLHSRSIEYGGLKCNNLLLHREASGELVVKLSDFGLSRVRTQSVPVSAKEKQDDVRWKAPERLVQATAPVDFSRSDIYAFGLCIMEAVTGETPFGMLGVEEIVAFKLADPPQPIERPEGGFINDSEWELVASMVDAKPEKRPTIDDVIAAMTTLDALRLEGGVEQP